MSGMIAVLSQPSRVLQVILGQHTTYRHPLLSMSSGEPLLEIPAQDLVKLIAQFLRENGLANTVSALETETCSALGTVDDLDLFRENITAGKWDLVLNATKSLDLPMTERQNLYEHIVFELVEIRQLTAAKILLRQSECLLSIKAKEPDRYSHLERLLTLVEFHPKYVYGDQDKASRRDRLAQSLAACIGTPIPPSRLLTLISNGIRWQAGHDPVFQSNLSNGGTWDILHDRAPSLVSSDVDKPVTHAYASLALSEPADQSVVEAVSFSPNGVWLATGSVDGIIEIWHPVSGKLRKDLRYQENEKFMAMQSAVLTLNWSWDSAQLISGSQLGSIKVWDIVSGKCVRRFVGVHVQGVTTVVMVRDRSLVMSGGFDGLIRSHGMQSGALIKEYRGHTSFVNSIVLNGDESRLFSGSTDGLVKIWDCKTGVCVKTLSPSSHFNNQPAVTHLHWIGGLNQVQIGTRGRTVQRVDERGTLIVSVVCEMSSQQSSRPTTLADPVSWAVTNHGEYTYMVTESGLLWTVHAKTKSVSYISLGLKKVIGLATCPGANVIAVWTECGTVALWKA